MKVPRILFYSKNQTPSKIVFLLKYKKKLTEKFAPFLKKVNSINIIVKINFCDNAGKIKLLKKIMRRILEEIYLVFAPLGTP